MLIAVKRVYDPPEESDGKRILVDRLWPRGLKKENAQIVAWMKEVAPSNSLRRWFSHDPRKWLEFKQRYRKELESSGKMALLRKMAEEARVEKITLLYAAKDAQHNNAAALKVILEAL